MQRTLALGGRRLVGTEPDAGSAAFHSPTVIADVAPGMPLFDEETFGPAAAIIRARDGDDAVSLANRSPYALSCSIWTHHIERARRVAADIQAGAVFINSMPASDPRLPFGGVKRYGWGRELGSFGIREFVNVQTVALGP